MRRFPIAIVAVFGLVLCDGCIKGRVAQTKEDAEVGAVVMESWIRGVQATGTEGDMTLSYNGRGGGWVCAGGFQWDTGITATMHVRVNPELATDKTPVGPLSKPPIGGQGTNPPADPSQSQSLERVK